MASFGSIRSAVFDREEKKHQYQAHILGLNAFDRHKKEDYRFIRSEEDDMDSSWEQRLVKRYYDKLFKEYPLEVGFMF
ncbi:Folate-sensitive fragile site protein Fra10Ac1, partial [Cynara cardunculus var. scolymus]